MGLALAGSFFRIVNTGFVPAMYLQALMCACVLVTYLFRHYISVCRQAYIVCFCVFLAGVAGTWAFGLTGNGTLLFVCASIIACFIVNLTTALFLAAAGLVVKLACAWMVMYQLEAWFTPKYQVGIGTRDWFNAITGYAFVLGIALFLIHRFFGYLKHILSQQEQVIASQTSQLSESSVLLESVVNSLPYGVLWKDKDLKFIGVNHQYLRDAGFDDLSQVIGKTDIELAVHELSKKYHQMDEKLIKGEIGPQTFEQQLSRNNGPTVYSVINRVPLKSDRGDTFGVLITYYDTTERKQMELSLQQAKEHAEQSSLAKSQFLANMSHEIRTPINGVLGLLDLCLESAKDKQQADYLSRANASAKLLLRLINDVLDLSKIEAGQLTLEEIPFHPQTLPQQLSEMFSQQAKVKGIDFNVTSDASADLCLVADPTRVIQVLMNLCSNAIKFTEQGEVRVNLNYQQSNDKVDVQIEVKDTGIGIPSSKIDTLFDSFTQADAATTRKFGGTGLGLAIVKQLVEIMQGQIEVQSQEGQGSRFLVTLPLAICCEAQTHQLDAVGNQDTQLDGVRLLVVEDNLINQEIAQAMLERAGAKVDIAENGQQGLSCIAENHYDLVLMDIQMPVMDGIEAIKSIRGQPEYVSLPVVALTANVMKEDIESYQALGFTSHLGKPFERRELLALVAKMLDREAAD